MPITANTLTATNILEGMASFNQNRSVKLTFIILLYLDAMLTSAAMIFGLYELNAVVRSIFDSLSLFVAFKLVLPPLIAWLSPGILLVPSIPLIIFVVAWNVKELMMFAL